MDDVLAEDYPTNGIIEDIVDSCSFTKCALTPLGITGENNSYYVQEQELITVVMQSLGRMSKIITIYVY